MNHTSETLKIAFQHHKAGQLKEAEAVYRKILKKEPNHPDALHLLGWLAHQAGDNQGAIKLISMAITANAHNRLYCFNLGNIYMSLGDWEMACRAFEKTLKLSPDFAEACNNLGSALRNLNRSEHAIEQYRKAIQLKPEFSEAYYNLGNALREQGLLEDAINSYYTAIRIRPDYAKTYNNLGNALRDIGNIDAAIESYKKALKIAPDFNQAHSNLLFQLSYNVLRTPAEMLTAHREWDLRHGGLDKAHTFPHSHGGDPDRRLRIGYVSPDLKRHAVSTFFEATLRAHDREQVEVYCYAEVGLPDAVTARLKALADNWCVTVGQSDEQLAHTIHGDKIDILVDLAGHTAHNRLKIFTYKPAPVQVSYIGYCTTTGLATMDYWITDETLHPTQTEELAVETIYRLPRCWVSYQPSGDAPEVVARPAGGAITFGSFNSLFKLTPQVIEIWSRILQSVPGSRLFLKTSQLTSPEVCAGLQDKFAAHGIGAERLELKSSSADYLAAYGEIDIALDPFPRTGGVTTTDALWMGVAVVTLSGQRYIERQGASILTAVGLEELIAKTEEAYIAKAVAWRKIMPAGVKYGQAYARGWWPHRCVMGRGLAHALERAYREMWHSWCAGEAQ